MAKVDLGAAQDRCDSLRRELMLFGIDVVIVAPGAVITPIWDNKIAEGSPLLVNMNFTPRGLNNIAADLLTLSELESGRSSAQPGPISLSDALSGAIRAVEPAASPRAIVRAPRIMGEAYKRILKGLVARGWAPPRTRVKLGNDVSVATEAEFLLGAAKPYDSILGVFWGTGVGGGIVLLGALVARKWTIALTVLWVSAGLTVLILFALIAYVFVNGIEAVSRGECTGALGGRTDHLLRQRVGHDAAGHRISLAHHVAKAHLQWIDPQRVGDDVHGPKHRGFPRDGYGELGVQN